MEKNNMRPATFIFLLSSVFFVFQASSAFAAITITCGQCQQGNCNCNIDGCPGESGLLSIYLTNQCSGSPVFKVPFTSKVGVWSPDNYGSFYGRALCDDRTTKSDCSLISVTQTITCNDDSCKQTCTGKGNITGSCDANNQCQCYGTSESSKCSDGTAYGECSSEKPKYCTSSGELIDDCNTCGCSSDSENCTSGGSCEKATTTPSGGGSDMGLILGIIVVIVIIFVIVYFLFLRKKKSRSSTKASYEDLYRKWSR